eukprot:6139186-Pyramimonas_sp.AAC.2
MRRARAEDCTGQEIDWEGVRGEKEDEDEKAEAQQQAKIFSAAAARAQDDHPQRQAAGGRDAGAEARPRRPGGFVDRIWKAGRSPSIPPPRPQNSPDSACARSLAHEAEVRISRRARQGALFEGPLVGASLAPPTPTSSSALPPQPPFAITA